MAFHYCGIKLKNVELIMKLDNEEFFANPYFPPSPEPCEHKKIAQSHMSVITVLNTRRCLDMIWCVLASMFFLSHNYNPIWIIFGAIGLIGFLTDIFMSLATDSCE